MEVILFDKQEITREGLKSILLTHPSVEHIEIIGQENELLQHLSEHPDAVIFLDYTLIDTTAERLLIWQQRYPQSSFVLFSDSLSKEFARRMIFTSSRFHILLKDSSVEEVLSAFDDIRKNIQFVNQKVRVWMELEEKVEKITLTNTEREILKSMSLGKTTKEIAAERFSSVHTIMTHRKNIFRKLDVNNAQEAIRYAVQTGIVDVMEYYI